MLTCYFFASMISDLFCASGKQEDLQSRVKGQIPKKALQCELVGFRRLEVLGSIKTFLFRETGVRFCSSAYDFTPGNWIIDGYRFSLWKYVDRINSFVQPIRYLIWLLVLSVLY